MTSRLTKAMVYESPHGAKFIICYRSISTRTLIYCRYHSHNHEYELMPNGLYKYVVHMYNYTFCGEIIHFVIKRHSAYRIVFSSSKQKLYDQIQHMARSSQAKSQNHKIDLANVIPYHESFCICVNIMKNSLNDYSHRCKLVFTAIEC